MELKSNSTTDNYQLYSSNYYDRYSTVKTSTGSNSKKTAVTMFRDFTFQTCWEDCKKFYPATIAVNGPPLLEQSSANPVCSFPFTLNNKQHFSCIPYATMLREVAKEIEAPSVGVLWLSIGLFCHIDRSLCMTFATLLRDMMMSKTFDKC